MPRIRTVLQVVRALVRTLSQAAGEYHDPRIRRFYFLLRRLLAYLISERGRTSGRQFMRQRRTRIHTPIPYALSTFGGLRQGRTMRSLVEPDVIGPTVLSTETMVFASTEVLTTFERPSSPVEDFYNSYFADETSEHDINAWGQMYI